MGEIIGTRGRAAAAAACWLLAGCTVDSDSGATSFGAGSTPPPTTTIDPDSGGTAGTTTTGATGGTTTTSGSGTSMGSGSSGTDGNQPMSGMYADCRMTVECVGLTTCIVDNDAAPTDGFCTRTPCVDPALDCNPSPGGTTTVVCATLPVGMVMQTVCALDCGAGQTCPGGMVCATVGTSMVCI